jgi:hypothetical protein
VLNWNIGLECDKASAEIPEKVTLFPKEESVERLRKKDG